MMFFDATARPARYEKRWSGNELERERARLPIRFSDHDYGNGHGSVSRVFRNARVTFSQNTAALWIVPSSSRLADRRWQLHLRDELPLYKQIRQNYVTENAKVLITLSTSIISAYIIILVTRCLCAREWIRKIFY